MVEGHSVHRVATMHRQRLVGKVFQATSPNGRFADGAKAIDGKVFYRIEAVGKNLFAFFRPKNDNKNADVDDAVVVVHVHFGMAGNWAVFQNNEEEVPEPTATNRLRLQQHDDGLTADLSAMTVDYGGMELYHNKRAKLGHDPLRDDANPEALWTKVKQSKKSIGALIMDQSFFTGPGNIYRAEILFKAGVHPDIPGLALKREEFDRIWHHTVALLQRGYQTGSILTVDPDEAKRLGKSRMRRYIYNTKNCPRCQSRIQVWDIASRTCYACPECQPKRLIPTEQTSSTPKSTKKKKKNKAAVVVTPQKEDCVPFNSHCARESVETRLKESGPERLTIKEIKGELTKLGVEVIPKGLRKAALIKLLQEELAKSSKEEVKEGVDKKEEKVKKEEVMAVLSPSTPLSVEIVSSEQAAAEKAAANESLAIEHIAELAPIQARRARAKAAVVKKEEDDDEELSQDAAVDTTTIEGNRKKRKKLVTPKKRRVSPSPKTKKRKVSP